MKNYFTKETELVLKGWDRKIYMSSVPGKPDHMQLTKPLPCGESFIPTKFVWNGSSSGPLRNMPIIGFPKWKHPIASCRHDFRCSIAKNKEERKIADKLFREDIGIRGTKWEQLKGYWGVRIGAILGIGSNY
jgi:hypothetical protein